MYFKPKMVQYFGYFEEREEAFRAEIMNLIPRKYAGTKNFWIDMKTIQKDELVILEDNCLSYIAANPQDALAFNTPSQVIRAVLLRGYNKSNVYEKEYRTVLEKYELTNNENQPLYTLSGGEKVKLAIAKCFIMSNYSKRLIISSPFSWLAHENMHMLNTLIKVYANEGKEVKILALNGENDDSIVPNNASNSQLNLHIQFENVVLQLKSNIEDDDNQGKAIIKNADLNLKSPCLFKGNNGYGKSLVSFVLSKSIKYDGNVTIICDGFIGFGRMIFQDVLAQTLLRSFSQLSKTSLDPEKVMKIYNEILHCYKTIIYDTCKNMDFIGFKDLYGQKTLLELKIVMVACRLSSSPSVIILDEPEWGLTKASSVALIKAIIKVAHSQEVAIIIISHKKWWDKIVNSSVSFQKKILDSNSFIIEMNTEGSYNVKK